MSTRTGSLIDPRNYEQADHWYRQGNVIAWYDRYIKLWTVYAVTPEGHQAGPAQYAPHWSDVVREQGQGAYPAPLYDD